MWTGAVAQAQDGGTPVVVELFTSQGCSSCPPADRFLGELAQRDDVIALSFHVNYWDYIGWQDPFATDATTDRQYRYAERLGQRNVYTPQMVIAGRTHHVGSDVSKVTKAIDEITAAPSVAPALELSFPDDQTLRVSVGASHYFGEADVVLVRYDKQRQTDVARGENAGRSLTNFNIVRDVTRIGSWSGMDMDFDLEWAAVTGDGSDGCAVLVQETGNGPVLAAAELRMTPAGN